jgi:hypothetical protein
MMLLVDFHHPSTLYDRKPSLLLLINVLILVNNICIHYFSEKYTEAQAYCWFMGKNFVICLRIGAGVSSF